MTGNPGPEPWNQHHPIGGQDGYFWTYFSRDSDVRVVYRGGDPRDVQVGTVRPNPDGDRYDMATRLRAYDTEGETVAVGQYTVELARLLALHDRAARLAAQRAAAQLREVTADRTGAADLEAFQRCVERAGWTDWDFYYLRSQEPLSGLGGDPTLQSLLHELGLDPDVDPDPDGDIREGLELRYENAFHVAWREELLRIARQRIAADESCTHRCREGRHCGGCGCPGCGYLPDTPPPER